MFYSPNIVEELKKRPYLVLKGMFNIYNFKYYKTTAHIYKQQRV